MKDRSMKLFNTVVFDLNGPQQFKISKEVIRDAVGNCVRPIVGRIGYGEDKVIPLDIASHTAFNFKVMDDKITCDIVINENVPKGKELAQWIRSGAKVSFSTKHMVIADKDKNVSDMRIDAVIAER